MQQRRNSSEHHTILVPLLSFFLTVIFVAFVIFRLQVADIRNQRVHAKNLIVQVSYNIQMAMDEYINDAQFWRTLLSHDKDKVQAFESLAEAMFVGNKCINAIQLAPDGIVGYSYPNNEDALGGDLLNDPIHRDDANFARLSRLTTIAGPFPQRHGGDELFVRTPIYLKNESGFDDFWGFSIIVLDAAEIFKMAHLSDLKDDNYDYQLKAINPYRGKLEMINCSKYDALNKPVSHSFDIHNVGWTLFVAPEKGWQNYSLLLFEILVGLIFASLVAFSTNSLLKLIKRESTFKKLSYIDNLTKLYNSRKFYELMTDLYRGGQPYAILYIDLNKFKPINDTYGHSSGDELLRIVAKKVKNCIREGDEVFRIGGDEFTILLPNDITINGLSNLVQRIKTSIDCPTALGSATVQVSASIGYARYPQDGSSFENILQIAEEMMYADKKAMGEER